MDAPVVQSQAVVEIRWEARNSLPAQTTSHEIIQQLKAMKASQIEAVWRAHGDDTLQKQAAITAIDLAILEECDYHRAYKDDLRRFFEIALPNVHEADCDLQHYGLFGRPFQDIWESFEYLRMEVASINVPDIPSKAYVLVNLKRHWRWLGYQVAGPYEPLVEFVTGKVLRLE
ncbi:MAG: hypothetical protein Q9225_007158 [Loekoesia sp. 1 TL-2023]